ncbi:MAG: FG-GAP repeat protein, partial [Planctomycetota bacterium]
MHASFCAPLWLSLSLPALAQTYDVSTLAPPGGPVANTGRAIDVDGTRAIFGSSNGAWIAERQATGRWEVVADLVAPGVLTTAQYGQAVAIDGDRAVVGAPVDSSPGFTTGSICIFERDPAGLWAFSAQLFLPSAVALPLFGGAVDVDGDRIAVGASFERSPFGNQNSGVVHVFDRDAGGNWVLDATLGSPSATNGYRLGFSVALDGERLIAGAPNFGAPGHAFVFERTFFGWQEVADLMGSGAGSTGEFGAAVELSGPTAVVGGPGDDSVTSNSGAAWAYRRLVSGTWVEEQKLLPSNALLGGSAGQALQLSDNRLLMGVPLADGAGVVNAGMADLFERDGSGAWTLAQTLIPSAPTVDQRAGYGVGLGDGWVLLGAPG